MLSTRTSARRDQLVRLALSSKETLAIRTLDIASWQLADPVRCPLWVKSRHSARKKHVRFAPESRHSASCLKCPLRANSGHGPSIRPTVREQEEETTNRRYPPRLVLP